MRLLSLLVIVSGFAFGAGMGVVSFLPQQTDRQVRSTGKALVGGPFSLVDHSGKSVTEATYDNTYKLIYFGFTRCPDICPGSLQVMSEALNALAPDKAAKITPLFISIDPERDTPDELAAYVESFHPRLVGLTGTPTQVAAAAKAFRVYYGRVKSTPGDEDYSMDHSSIMFLMAPNGEYLTSYSHGVKVAELTSGLNKLVN